MSAKLLSDPDHLRKVNVLLDAALSLHESERAAWLRTLPPEQQPFVPLLTSLLERASVETDRFMQSPIGLALEGLGDVGAEDDQAGDHVGPYRLIRELGSGGMATVWLAERSDGVLHRQVALKLPREGWAAGLAQRMARERDLLGTLEHAHIARLYDAGVTASGRPWMAMECVNGMAIDTYCEAHALDVPQRLRLFVQVTRAVAHAHAHLIVHRDLKPSNILVTPEAQARLLDFGVAKLLASGVNGSVLEAHITQHNGRAMTPDYAAPEQIAGKPVTVATDLYSLGVVLYELLTGQRPYRLGRQSAAALEEAILAADVPLASARVHGNRALARQLRGNLDSLLVKALQKDPAQRYTSAEAFAADVQRHLDGETVLAQAANRGYRLVKFVRRHRLALAAASAVTASIVGGAAAALWQANEARSEAARAEQVKEFIASIFKQATPREGVGGVVTASDLLLAASMRLELELASNPRAAAELGVIIGQGFFSLGDPKQGEATLRAAVTRAEREFGRRHPIALMGKALFVESLEYKDIHLSERLLDELVPDALAGLPASAEAAVFALRGQSFTLARLGRHDAALAAGRRAVALGEQHLGVQHKDTVRALAVLANVHALLGERGEQLERAAEALSRARAAFGAMRPHPVLTFAERRYGEALINNARPADAVLELTRVVADQRLLDVPNTWRLQRALFILASAQADCGRLAEALPLMREAMALQARLAPNEAGDQTEYKKKLSQMLVIARRLDEAMALGEHSSGKAGSGSEAAGGVSLAQAITRAQIFALQGDTDAAGRSASAAADRAGEQRGELRAQAWIASAMNARLQSRPGEALAFAQRALADPRLKTFDLLVQADALAEAGNAWLDLGDFAQGETALLASRAIFERGQVDVSVRLADTLVGLARVHLHAGRNAQAETLLLPLVDAWAQLNAGSAWHGLALHWLARTQAAQGRAQAAFATQAAAAKMLANVSVPALRSLGGALTDRDSSAY